MGTDYYICYNTGFILDRSKHIAQVIREAVNEKLVKVYEWEGIEYVFFPDLEEEVAFGREKQFAQQDPFTGKWVYPTEFVRLSKSKPDPEELKEEQIQELIHNLGITENDLHRWKVGFYSY